MTKQKRKELFLRLLELYYLDQRRLSCISRSLGISEATAHNWFNRWVKKELFTDIERPKDIDTFKIMKGRYL
jgi:DNA-binding transcriptional regulator LsrR (DeoR family)